MTSISLQCPNPPRTLKHPGILAPQSVGLSKMIILSGETLLNWAMEYMVFTRVNPARQLRSTSKQMSSYVYRYSKMQTPSKIKTKQNVHSSTNRMISYRGTWAQESIVSEFPSVSMIV